jgi:alpha-L-fucosidase
VFEVDVLVPGDYNASLTYSGEGRLVWGIDVEGGEHIQNEQNSSHNYQEFPIGWINFPTPGKYKVAVSCLEGDLKTASLKAIRFTPVQFGM